MPALLVLILLFGVMYAAMIRPQQRRAREHQALVAAVQVGDEVMTTAGIFGTVTAVEGDVISIEISPGVVMRVARAAIGRRMSGDVDEYDDSETIDDVDDDDLGATNGHAVGNDQAAANDDLPTAMPEPPPSAPAAEPSGIPAPPPIQTPPPVTPPPSETPPPAAGGPAEQG